MGANVDTDQLAPGGTMKFGIDVIARHCLRESHPQFHANVKPGDVIAAGPNFGIGSSREQAVEALLHLGVFAVIAPSFSGLFFRNAFNLGLLLLTCRDAERLVEGEHIRMAPKQGRILRHDGACLDTEPLPQFLWELSEAGGLLPLLKKALERSDQSSDPDPAIT